MSFVLSTFLGAAAGSAVVALARWRMQTRRMGLAVRDSIMRSETSFARWLESTGVAPSDQEVAILHDAFAAGARHGLHEYLRQKWSARS